MAVEERVVPTKYVMVLLVVIALALTVGIVYDNTQPRFMKIHHTNCYNPEHDPCAMNGTCDQINLSKLNFTGKDIVWYNGSYCEVEWR